MNLDKLTISQTHLALEKKNFSVQELVQSCFKKIKKENSKLNAFLGLNEEGAMDFAQKIDHKITQGGKLGILEGIPLAIKDNILVQGLKATAGSKILENYLAPYDATVIEKLRGQGAIFLGKTNLDEFAMGSSSENSAFGPVHNPHDLKRVPGGSSGGSAAAVAAHLCLGALGSDTGGSVRQPAAFCGVVGLKPTYGSVSRYGLIAMASSLDQIGTMAKNVEDAEIIFQAIKGKDNKDATSVESNFKSKIPACRQAGQISNAKLNPKLKLKIGVPKEYFVKGIDSKVKEIIEKEIKKLEKQGAEIKEISLPHTQYALACYYILMSAEASTNLARYDGLRFGYNQKTENYFKQIAQSREQGFGLEAKRRIILGTFVLSAGYYDAYYEQAQKVRQLIKNDFKQAFEKVDLIITPTAPTTAFKINEKTKDPLQMYLSDIFTVPASLAGLPALSLPIGKISELPVGLQIIGQEFSEEKICALGKEIEKS